MTQKYELTMPPDDWRPDYPPLGHMTPDSLEAATQGDPAAIAYAEYHGWTVTPIPVKPEPLAYTKADREFVDEYSHITDDLDVDLRSEYLKDTGMRLRVDKRRGSWEWMLYFDGRVINTPFHWHPIAEGHAPTRESAFAVGYAASKAYLPILAAEVYRQARAGTWSPVTHCDKQADGQSAEQPPTTNRKGDVQPPNPALVWNTQEQLRNRAKDEPMSINYGSLGIKRTVMNDFTEELNGVTLVETFVGDSERQAFPFGSKITIHLLMTAPAGNEVEFIGGPFKTMAEALAVFGPHHFEKPYADYRGGQRRIEYTVHYDGIKAAEAEDAEIFDGSW